MGIGSVEIAIELLPKIPKSSLLTSKSFYDQATTEKQLNNHEVLKFNEYATKWWKEYKQINIEFRKRPVKIYAEDENGI